MHTLPASYFLVTLLSKVKLKVKPKLGRSLPICIGKAACSGTDHTETPPLTQAGKHRQTRTALFLLKIALNKGFLHFRQLSRKLEHSAIRSSGLPAHISISFRKLPWFVQWIKFPSSQQEKKVCGIQRLTKVSHKGSKQASIYRALRGDTAVCFTYSLWAANLCQHCLVDFPCLHELLSGKRVVFLEQNATLVNERITVYNQLMGRV